MYTFKDNIVKKTRSLQTIHFIEILLIGSTIGNTNCIIEFNISYRVAFGVIYCVW